MPRTLVTGNILRSGSIPTTALTGGVISSSAQLPTGTISSSAQFTSLTAPFTGSFTGSLTGTSSAASSITFTTFSNASFLFPQNIAVNGTASFRRIETQFVTSSIIYESGSSRFGDSADDVMSVTGSLQVTGSIVAVAGNSGSPALTTVGDTNTGIYFPAADTIGFVEGGTEAMRIDSSGNVGIGVTSPSSYGRLAVLSGATASTAYFDNTAASAYSATSFFAGSILTLRTGANATARATGIRFASNANGALEGLFAFVQNASSSGDFVWQGYNGSAYAERMRLDASGSLGLGVTPSAWASSSRALQMNGGNLSTSTGGTFIEVIQNAYFNGTNYVYNSTAQASRYTQAAGLHYWYTAASGTAGNNATFTQAMTLDANGVLFVGATDSITTGVRALITGGSTTQPALLLKSTATNGTTFIGDRYAVDEQTWTLGVGYSGGGLVLGSSVKVSTTADNTYLSSQDTAAVYGAAMKIDGGNGFINFTIGSGSSTVTTGNVRASMTEVMRMVNGGNIGIGLTSPFNKLHIEGSSGIRVSDASGANFRGITFGATGGDSTEYSYIKWHPNSGEFRLYANTAGFGGFMSFYSNNAEAMRINSAGNIGIGTTNPGTTLDVNGTTKSNIFRTTKGTVSAAPSTNTTFFTPSSIGLYIAHVYLASNQTSVWDASIIFMFNTTDILVINQTNSTNVSTVVSGTNVQVRQIGAATYTFDYEVFRLN